MATKETNRHFAYAEKILLLVSRTFALNINVLSGDLRKTVLLAYLYLRIADTLEDDPKLPASEKKRLLGLFASIFEEGTSVPERTRIFREALPADWANSSDPNYDLSLHAEWVVPLLWDLPEALIKPTLSVVREMCEGMGNSVVHQEASLAEGWYTLETQKELDDYCYFVAGIVGKMLSDLFYASSSRITEETWLEMKKWDVSFGLALQLVNIIKDVKEDSLRKVCFVPEAICRKHGFEHSYDMFLEGASEEARALVMQELVKKAWDHLNDAVRYTLLIPRVNLRVRLFCLWPLFMAAENLVIIGDCKALFSAEKKQKITRSTVKKIIRSTLFHFYSNRWILNKFENIRARA